MYISKWTEGDIISALYHEGEKGWTMMKRFQIETSKLDTQYEFISNSSGSKLYYASTGIDVKGWKALGNKVGEYKVLKVDELKTAAKEEEVTKGSTVKPEKKAAEKPEQKNDDDSNIGF